MSGNHYGTPLSPQIAKSAVIRLSKIIGQLNSVAKMLEESTRDLDALTQYSAANAALASLMKLIAKDAVASQLSKTYDGPDARQYIYSLFEAANALEDLDEY